LRDPAAQRFNLLRPEFLPRVDGRHHIDVALIRDPQNHFTPLRMTGHDRDLT
jgi:hypothetical protein